MSNNDITLEGLEKCVAIYPIVSALAVHLSSRDLFSLSRITRTTWKYVWCNDSKTLLPKTSCDGAGIAERTQNSARHLSPGWAPHLVCSSKGKFRKIRFPTPSRSFYDGPHLQFDGSGDKTIQVQQCVRCGFQTCDECRFHCTYQSYFKKERRSVAYVAFVAHLALEYGDLRPLSPTTNSYELPWKFPGESEFRRKHDQGLIRPKFERRHREGIQYLSLRESALTRNLGSSSPSQHFFGPLVTLVEHRKRYSCIDCFQTDGPGMKSPSNQSFHNKGGPCDCTLRSQFLDRWLCIPCARAETTKDKRYYIRNTDAWSRANSRFAQSKGQSFEANASCSCGKRLDGQKGFKTWCSWCAGEVAGLPVDSWNVSNVD